MLKNYLITALRNLWKHKFYSAINILGLAIGITSFLFIWIYIQDELSYDKFHSKAERMYRVWISGKLGGQQFKGAVTCPPLAATIVDEFPEVEAATRLYSLDHEVIRYKDIIYTENNVFFADSNFFHVFDFNLLKGNPETALKEPNTLVITESTAKKYFGNKDALGKMVEVGDYRASYKVTGIVADPPSNSHFSFDILYAMSVFDFAKSNQWINNSFYTYLVLKEGSSMQALEEKLPSMVDKYVGPQMEQFMGVTLDELRKKGDVYGYFLQPMLDIHLKSDLDAEIAPQSDQKYIIILTAIALFIILIAAINFMNLSTARSSNRAKEVGIRKTAGSYKTQIIGQFLIESIVLSFFALILALFFASILVRPFNTIAMKDFHVDFFLEPANILLFVTVTLIIGLLAGSYPAFYLSAFKPIEVLTGAKRSGLKNASFRNVLVVFQFAISSGLLISTGLIFSQIQYIQNKDLGFDKENVVVIGNGNRIGKNIINYKNAILNESGVINAAVSTIVPPGIDNNTVFRPEGSESDHLLCTYGADYDHINTLNIKIREGRNFSRDFSSDSSAVLINEAAARELNWENNAINQNLIYMGQGEEPYKVIGVMEDFNFETLKNEIRPLVIILRNTGRYITVRINSENIPQNIKMLEKKWKEVSPGEPFEYTFLDQDFNDLFKNEQRLSKIYTIFTGLSIFVACLGLFGLTAYTAEQRTKEIGIRKVMGASVTNILTLLSRDFTKLIIISFIIAVPAAYYVIDQWLSNFAYRINIQVWAFIIPLASIMLFALLIINMQVMKAALTKPVNSLKYE